MFLMCSSKPNMLKEILKTKYAYMKYSKLNMLKEISPWNQSYEDFDVASCHLGHTHNFGSRFHQSLLAFRSAVQCQGLVGTSYMIIIVY